MDRNPQIKINVASASEIAELFGIGVKLAQRIVLHREKNGYIHGPEELAKIKGISINLAITLSSEINWEIPNQHKQTKERDIFEVLIIMSVDFAIIWFFLRIYIPRFIYFLVPPYNSPADYVSLWINGSGLAGFIFCILSISAYGISSYSRSTDSSRRINRIALFFSILMVTNYPITNIQSCYTRIYS